MSYFFLTSFQAATWDYFWLKSSSYCSFNLINICLFYLLWRWIFPEKNTSVLVHLMHLSNSIILIWIIIIGSISNTRLGLIDDVTFKYGYCHRVIHWVVSKTKSNNIIRKSCVDYRRILHQHIYHIINMLFFRIHFNLGSLRLSEIFGNENGIFNYHQYSLCYVLCDYIRLSRRGSSQRRYHWG